MSGDEAVDPFLWLEDILGEEPLDWVRARNEPTVAEFSGEEFERMRTEALEVLDTDARIPYVRRRGDYLYNFWRDAANPRGLWRRTTLDSYRSDTTDWDVLLDLDELSRADDQNWVWAGAVVIEPEFTRALVNLSRGGADAVVVREFDMETREFVVDGFELPEAKTQIGWDDPDTVLVGTDFGPDSLTESGYPRIVKRWRRGMPLNDAELIFEGARTDVSAGGSTDRTPGFERTFVSRATDFWNKERYQLRGSELIRIDVPSDASSISIHREWLLIDLRTDWTFGTTSYSAGSLLAVNYERIPQRCKGITRYFRTRRAHLPAPVRVDARPAAAGHAGRRGQPGRDRHTGQLGARTVAGHSRGDQQRGRRRRRHRRRILSGLQRIRESLTAVARHRQRPPRANQDRAQLL